MAWSTWNGTYSTPDTSVLPTLSVEVRPCMRTTRCEQDNEQRNVGVPYRKLRLRNIRTTPLVPGVCLGHEKRGKSFVHRRVSLTCYGFRVIYVGLVTTPSTVALTIVF